MRRCLQPSCSCNAAGNRVCGAKSGGSLLMNNEGGLACWSSPVRALQRGLPSKKLSPSHEHDFPLPQHTSLLTCGRLLSRAPCAIGSSLTHSFPPHELFYVSIIAIIPPAAHAERRVSCTSRVPSTEPLHQTPAPSPRTAPRTARRP